MAFLVLQEPQDIQQSVSEKKDIQHRLKVNDAGVANRPHKFASPKRSSSGEFLVVGENKTSTLIHG